MNQLKEILGQQVTLTNDEWQLFSSRLKRFECPKKTLLLTTGQVEDHLSFLEKGIIRYYIPKEENDLTFDFTFENNFTSAYDSFITRQPSIYNIQALTNCVLWRISYPDLQEVYNKSQMGNTIGRLAAEKLYLEKSRREKSLLNETAEQRYMNLFTEQEHLLLHIPLKYIASYIGVTPQALSRIRRRIS